MAIPEKRVEGFKEHSKGWKREEGIPILYKQSERGHCFI